MGFPILSLPYMAFRNIFKTMDFLEIICISLCSQRFRNLMKPNLNQLEDWNICAVMSPTPGIILQNGEQKIQIFQLVSKLRSFAFRSSKSKIELVRIGNTKSPVFMNPKGFLTVRLGIQTGMYECAKYVTDLFQKSLSMVEFGNKSTWMMDLPQKLLQRFVFETVFQSYGFLDKTALRYVLENCTAVNLKIIGWVDGGLQSVRFGLFGTIYVPRGHWVTVENVIDMKCVYISIAKTRWTCVDANNFLRLWAYARMPMLKWTRIDLARDEVVEEEKILYLLGEYVRRTDDGLEIHSWSGSMAYIVVDPVEKAFQLTVWPPLIQ